MSAELSPQSYLAFSQFLQKQLGIVLGDNRQYLVRSRLTAIARDCQYADINTFIQDVVSLKNKAISDRCLELMTTNETFWFRDGYPFSLLSNAILPSLFQQQKRLRIWSSACASGQEPYSIAMTICDFQSKHPGAFSERVEIVATDYSQKMITHAKEGIYDELALSRGLAESQKKIYFTNSSTKQMSVDNKLKSMVSFKRFNLLDNYLALGKFDIIFCRNVLIYFNGNEKVNILNKIAACLNSGGSLFLGAAESIGGAEHLFKVRTGHEGLYYTRL